MKNIAFIILAFQSFFCLATTPVIDLLDNVEMWEASDVIAVVQIERGAYSPKEQKYDVTGREVVSLKGGGHQTIEFTDSFLWQHPEKLGGYYLVYLRKSDSGFVTVKTGLSVIELSPADTQDEDDLQQFAAQRGIPDSALIKFGSKIWIVSTCLNGGREFCLNTVPAVSQAFNKSNQQGTATGTH